MRALVLHDSPELKANYPSPTRHPGEVRIQMRLAGVCDTDLQLARGYMGYRGVLGHEFVGVVTEADSPHWIGKRVVGDINAGCGQCEECQRHLGHHCSTRTVLGILGRDGALAEELVLPEQCLVEVPDSVADEHAVFAEPLAAALHVAEDLTDLKTTGPTAVLGDGKLGLLIALALHGAAKNGGCPPPTLIGRHPNKLKIAEAQGVPTALADSVQGKQDHSAVIDATGNPSGLALAFQLLAPRGRLILKTTVASSAQAKTPLDLSPIVINELEVRGSRCGDLRQAIAALTAGSVDPTPLIVARFPLAQADQALERAGQRGVLKVVVHGAT